MSRDLPVDFEAAIDGPVSRPYLAVRIELPDPVYAWTGQGTLTFNDSSDTEREWIGAGDLGSIDPVGESLDGAATGMKVTLNNVPSEFRDDIADQAVRGVLFEIYVGALRIGEDWRSVIATTMIWRGKLDEYLIVDSGATLSVQLTGESRAIDQKRPSIRRFTNEHQQRRHPGDRFFEFVPQMTEIGILWAKAEQESVAAGSGDSVAGIFGRQAIG